MNNHRKTQDGPFCWQSKAALARIAAACDSRTDKAHVLAVYVAMTWEASNRQSQTFDIHVRHVAAIAGVSYKKAGEVLSLLGALGLLVARPNFIDGTKEKGANTYTLGTVSPTLGTIDPRLGTAAKPGTLARVLEESSEESLELAPNGATRTGEARPILKTKKARQRNPLLDSLASIDGSDPAQVTGKAWAGIAAALVEIREVFPEVTPDEINRRAGNYRHHMPEATISANALAKHWARCDRPPQAQPAHQPARNYPLLTA